MLGCRRSITYTRARVALMMLMFLAVAGGQQFKGTQPRNKARG